MTDFLKVLLNIRSLRAALGDLTQEQLKEAHERFESIYLERAALVEKEQAAQA
jgi:DNA-binding protein H-NS